MTETRAGAHFDLTAPLPTTTTVVEASAGTGKTFAIVGIAAAQIAAGVPIGSLLLVTFSRAATAELRDRMRGRLVQLVAVLEQVQNGATVGEEITDSSTRELATGTAEQIAERLTNLVGALSDFDASIIATTHTFCSRMLEALGFLGERESSFSLVDEVDEVVDQAAMDLFLLGFARSEAEPDFGPDIASKIAKEAVRNAGVELSPPDEALDTERHADAVAARRVRFCRKVREIVEMRKRMSRLRTYDDLQQILYRVVTDEEVGEQACERIRDAFQLVLVDEFQDTDPFQWEILRRCFHQYRQLVLVGDPKQSIYAFRGAEVLSYLDAVRVAEARFALDTNWRSDGDLVVALDKLYGGLSLGHRDIAVHQVQAARPGSRLNGVPALRLRWFTAADFPARSERTGIPPVSAVREAVIDDVAADIARLLNSGTTITRSDRAQPDPVHPGDIAVLVSANKTIEPLQRALATHGIGSVVGAGSSIFATMSAQYWLWVLQAIDNPSATGKVSLAGLTPLIGLSAADLAAPDSRAAERLTAELAGLAQIFTESGFSALSQRLLDARHVPSRVLGASDGERLLTDLIQVATVCNRHVVETSCGLSALTEWLAERIADPSKWRGTDEQTRRLDRDTEVVQIMTVHASKGLEFPIVYVPFGWDSSRFSKPETFRFHDDDATRNLDVGGVNASGARQRLQRSVSEDAGEELRKLYVALTRAGAAVVAWWAPSRGTPESALHRMLFGRATAAFGAVDDGPLELPENVRIPADDDLSAHLREFAQGPESIAAEAIGPSWSAATDLQWRAPGGTDSTGPLSAAEFTADIDQGWRRTSYSAIIAGAGHHGPAAETRGGEPEVDDVGIVDEPADQPGQFEPQMNDAGHAEPTPPGHPSPMNGMPFGAAFGTLIHEVLEYVDTAQPDMGVHLRELCAQAAARHALAVEPELLATAMAAVLTTPIGFGDLWAVAPADRLAEMDFELPLAEKVGAGATLHDIARLMRRHLPDDDLLRPYADILHTLPTLRLRGFLTGSVDSVLRAPDGRFVIVDYKTNRLRPGDLSAEDFTQDTMAGEMIAAHYPLQALLYSVALHRYLRWRMPGYSPAEHLGEVQYHFVRGMVGPQTPAGCGVFSWSLPTVLVVELSDLLSGGSR